ncbi:MAG: hypothetical protein J0L62_16430 [Bacteroidetes bacterium]|nr:hypothetical protein [Bacteroidota bacterium]
MSIKKVIIIIAIGISISLVASCFSTEHYLIKGINFSGVKLTNPEVQADKDKYFVDVFDTLNHRLFFRVIGMVEYQYGYLYGNSFVTSCYATSVPERLDNSILIDSLQLKLNSDIYFENVTIKANTDLWNHPQLKAYRWYFNYTKKNDIDNWFILGFIDSFYDIIRVPNKEYEIEITCKTNDGLIFVERKEVYIQLEK